MSEASRRGNDYLFGHADDEIRRLQQQAQLFNPSTRRMLDDAGISRGMKVLDVGSGAGDVALLLAELVGPQGAVVGVDSDTVLLDTARARVQAAGTSNISFVAGDVMQVALDADFDAAVGRCVLFFVPDPVTVVRRVAQAVRPGGSIAFQEPGNAAALPVAVPASPLLDRMSSWMMDLYRRAGMDLYMGLRLFPIFLEAGLPAPEMHLDAAVGGGAEWADYDYMASLVRTLLPRFEQYEIATAEEVQADTFAERLRTEVVSQRGVMTTRSFVTAWTRKPRLVAK